MRSEERYNLSKLTTAQRFQLMFGQRITPTYPMPLDPEQRADIHMAALNYWNASPDPNLLDLANLVMEQYERFHSPTQMERTNHELDRDLDQARKVIYSAVDVLDRAGVPKDTLAKRIQWLLDHSQPAQTLTVSPTGNGFTIKNEWDKPNQPNQP
jgi:hypothetical protein